MSRYFSGKGPSKPHLLRSKGLAGEIKDLRSDVDEALDSVEDELPDPAWAEQAEWYIDPLTGDDDNDGTEATPLATFAEVRRRLEPVGIKIPTTIYIVSDLAAEDPVGMTTELTSTLTIQGVPTTVYTGEVSAWVRDESANNPGALTDASWTVADHVHQHVLFTSGDADGMGCWLLEADYLGAGNARVSWVVGQDFGSFNEDEPGVGDTFLVQTFPSVTLGTINHKGDYLQLKYLRQREIDTVFARIDSPLKSVAFAASYFALGGNGSIVDGYGFFGLGVGCNYFSMGGAFRNFQADTGCVLSTYSPMTADTSVEARYNQAVTIANGGFLNLSSDTYFFGDWTYGYVLYSLNSNIDLLSTSSFRGDIAGTDYFIRIRGVGGVVTERTDHSIVNSGAGTTDVRFVGSGIDVPLNGGGVSDPAFLSKYGSSSKQGAVGSVRVGVKGALTTGTRYALADLTESATDVMRTLVTNRSFVRNLYVKLGTAPGGTDTVVVTVMVDGVASDVTVTITGTEIAGSDVANTALVSPGQEVSFRVVKSGALAEDLSVAVEAG